MKTFACMFDCSRNAVLNLRATKRLVLLLEKMGYNSMMLYTEDTYEVANEPYFGYFRGRYSENELKEIVAFGQEHGIEVIPCVELLAHVNSIFHWGETYGSIWDAGDVMMADEPRTYELIENIFASLEKCFLSRRVNVGLDETWVLGTGAHLRKYGFEQAKDILLRHLGKISLIAKKHGFEVLMWSDMFVRLAMGGEYYSDTPRLAKPEVKSLIPEGVKLIYWDYYHPDEKTYEAMMQSHKSLQEDPWFAGGIWTWNGFAPFNALTIHNTKSAFAAAKKEDIQNIIMTLWKDNGGECSFFAGLPGMFYASELAKGIEDEKTIKADFKKSIGYDFDDFLLLDDANKIASSDPTYPGNPCKYLLYNDPLCGIYDYKVDEKDDAIFEKTSKKLLQKAPQMGDYAYLFKNLGYLTSFMALKNSLGLKARKAYQAHDQAALKKVADSIPEAEKRLALFISSFRDLWYQDNKPFGFDVQEIRLGGLALRLEEMKRTLADYLSARTSSIPEFEVSLLSLHPVEKELDKKPEWQNSWSYCATVNVL